MRHKILFLFYFLLFSVTTMYADNWGSDVEPVTPIMNDASTNIYHITTPQQLAYMTQELNKNALKGTTVIVLENDIDLGGKDWIPMNPSSKVYFRGNDHVIKNLTIANSQEFKYVGLFGGKGNTFEGAVLDIADVRLTEVNISVNEKTYNAGALVGYATQSRIVNCHAEGTISSVLTTSSNSRTQGGLIGCLDKSTLDRSSAAMTQPLSGNVIQNQNLSCLLGGLVGKIDGVGGLETTVINCHSTGKISLATVSGSIFSALRVGGLGNTSMDNGLPGLIANCYSVCAIQFDCHPEVYKNKKQDQIYVGGLLGGLSYSELTISNCFFKSTITTPSGWDSRFNKGLLFGRTTLVPAYGASTGTLTCNNNFHPQGTAIGKEDNPFIQTGISQINESTFLDDLNNWVNANPPSGIYLPWKKENETGYTFHVIYPVEGTDYVWNDDICTLKTPTGLRWFSRQVFSFTDFTNKTIQLEEHGSNYWDVSESDWMPIGSGSRSKPKFGFSGTFDGKNQEVTYKMSKQATNSNTNGFFGCVMNGTIQNLIANGDIQNVGNPQGVGNAGIVVAQMTGGNLTNVVSKGTLDSPDGTSIGGIVGNGEYVTITDCRNEAAVIGKQFCGGIIGWADTDVTVTDCLNAGTITVTSQVCGGIAGYAQPYTVVNPLSFKNCRNEGVITGKTFCGGIVGALKYGEVIDCVNSGDVTGTQAVGGIVGDCDIQTIVNGCSNSGTIESKASGTTMTGGIAGRVYSNTTPAPPLKAVSSLTSEIIVINSNNTGAVSVPNGMCVGGIAGVANSKTTNIYIINCGNYGDISGSDYVSGIGTAQSAAAGVQTIIRNSINTGGTTATVTTSPISSSLVSYSSGVSGGVVVDHCFYKEQEGIEPVKSSGAETNLTTKEIIAISGNLDSYIDELNQGAIAFNKENQELPPANGWKTNNDQGTLEHGILPPVIEGETEFEEQITISISATAGTTIYYTTDGVIPTTASSLYTVDFLLTATTTIKAIAVLNGKESAVSEKTFTQKVPSVNPPYIPSYFNVTLPEVKGITTTPKAGNYVVEEGYNFSFSLALATGYENSRPIVKANGVIVEPRESDSKYIIRNVVHDMNITIEGIENPTGNVLIEGKVKVQAVGSSLYIYLPRAERVYAYTLSGVLYRELELPAGNSQVQLVKGFYLIKIGDNTYKITI